MGRPAAENLEGSRQERRRRQAAPASAQLRFLQPNLPSLSHVFCPDETLLSKDDLQKYVTGVMQAPGAPKYSWSVVATADREKDKPLVLLGTSFFGFYTTWVSASDY